jgi:hypothetical protein
MSHILILHSPLEDSAKEDIFKMEKSDIDLVKVAKDKSIKLKQQGIDVFEIKNNILIASDGYYVTDFAENVEKA